MSHYKRKKARTSGCGHYSNNGLENRLKARGISKEEMKHFYDSHPRHWDKVMHTRPARIRSNRLAHLITKGVIDADDTVWPDYRKPHIYYW